jgi:hypothetical protein
MSRFNQNSAMAKYTPNGNVPQRYNASSIVSRAGSERGFPATGMGIARATGGGAQSSSLAPLFGIVVTNASASAVSNLDLFGASRNLYAPTIGGASAAFNSAGALVSGGVTIQTLYSSSITYLEFLSSTMTQVFNVGSIHMTVTTGNNNQSYQTFLTTQKSQSGRLVTDPNTPLLDPATQQAGVSQSYVDFAINGLASMSWSSFFASTTLQISFFPSTTIDPANALVGQQVQKGWNAAL